MQHPLLTDALAKHANMAHDQAEDIFAPAYKTIAGHKIRFVRGPERPGPNLVLLNGMPQSIRCWESSWQALTAQYNVLAFDMPGFGLSPNSPAGMSPRNLAALIPAIMDAFDMDTAFLAGPDVGAPVALAAAIASPERLLGINIFDGPGFYPPAMDATLLASIKYPLLRWMLGGPMKKHLAKLNFQAATHAGYQQFNPGERAIREYFDITHDIAQTRNALAFLGSYKKDLRWIGEKLVDITLPVLITWGGKDQFVLPSNARDLHARISTSQLHIFEQAGHYSHEDAGSAYTNRLTSWIAANSTT